MSAHDSLDPIAAQQAQEDRRRKRKAVVAGGVVLGLGAAMTLATWTDNVFSKGSFQTGTFNLKGAQTLNSSSYPDYKEYDTKEAAADLTTGSTDGGVNFTLDSLNLSPGQTVVAPFNVATSQDTTVDGRYWLEEATVSDNALAPFLKFAIVQSPTCTNEDPATTATEQTDISKPWKSYHFTAADKATPKTFGSVKSAAGVGPDIALNKAFGNHSALCIAVTLDDDEAGIKAANAMGSAGNTTITWHFAGAAEPLTN